MLYLVRISVRFKGELKSFTDKPKKKKKSLAMQTLRAFPTHLSRGHPPALRKHFDFATQWAKDKSGGSTKGGR